MRYGTKGRQRGKIPKNFWEDHKRQAREVEEKILMAKMALRDAQPPRACCYRRCSHESSKRTQLGMEVQQAEVEAYVRLLQTTHPNLGDPEWYVDEAISGQKPFLARHGGQALHKSLSKGDHIVFARFDRGFRSTADALKMLEMWKRRNVSVHFVDLRCDLDTAQGQFLITIVAACAQLEAQRTSERNKAVAARLRAQNRPATGHAPMGKRIIGPKGQRRYCWNWDERRIMKRIVELHDNHGMSFAKIADALEGELSRRANRKPTREGWGRKWSRNRCQRGYMMEKRWQAEEAEAKAEEARARAEGDGGNGEEMNHHGVTETAEEEE